MKLIVLVFSLLFVLVAPNSIGVNDKINLHNNAAHSYMDKVAIPLANKMYEASEQTSAEKEPEDPSTRIYNGYEARLGNFPYQAGLIIYHDSGSFSCGGSLISATRVLTAAHCWWDGKVQGLIMMVVLGSLELNNGGVRLETSTVDVHRGWNFETLENDIAMVYLPQVVPFSDYVNPIALAPASWFEESFFEDTVIISGFGRVTEDRRIPHYAVLRYVDLQVVGNPRCYGYYGNVVSPSIICAQSRYDSNACPGDSGGPLIIVKNNQRYLFGVASFAPEDCESGGPSGYTRVTSYLDWIEQRL